MIKLLDILENKILVPRRSKEERQKKYQIALQKNIQQYIKDGSKGDLYLSNTPITSLPDNLEVGGDLSLRNTQIKELPNNLKVGGNLTLSNTQIEKLPDNLEVNRNLDLYNTQVKELPGSLEVGGSLYLKNTPLSKKYTKQQIKDMVPRVEGQINYKL